MCDTIEGVRQVDTTGNGSNVGVPNAAIPAAGGAGLDKALPNYAGWFKSEYLPGSEFAFGYSFVSCRFDGCLTICWLTWTGVSFSGCASFNVSEWSDPMNVECFNSYNATNPFYTDKTPDSVINQQLGVQWAWMQCNQPMMWYHT